MLRSIVTVLVTLFSPLPLHAASFDCDKAKTVLEHSICNHKPLNELDSEMGGLYRNLLKTLDKVDAELLKQSQRRWLETRTHLCNEKNLACLTELYQGRISNLEFRGSAKYASSAAGKVSGFYVEGNMNVTVEALSENTVAVTIQGAEPDVGKWTCEFSETGTLTGNTVKLKSLDDAVVTVKFQKGIATVDEGDDSSLWCGSGGTLNGTYKRR